MCFLISKNIRNGQLSSSNVFWARRDASFFCSLSLKSPSSHSVIISKFFNASSRSRPVASPDSNVWIKHNIPSILSMGGMPFGVSSVVLSSSVVNNPFSIFTRGNVISGSDCWGASSLLLLSSIAYFRLLPWLGFAWRFITFEIVLSNRSFSSSSNIRSSSSSWSFLASASSSFSCCVCPPRLWIRFFRTENADNLWASLPSTLLFFFVFFNVDNMTSSSLSSSSISSSSSSKSSSSSSEPSSSSFCSSHSLSSTMSWISAMVVLVRESSFIDVTFNAICAFFLWYYVLDCYRSQVRLHPSRSFRVGNRD